MAIWCYSTGDDNTLNAATQGTTAYASDGTAGADGSIALVYELQTNAGATGTTAMTQSVNGPDNWVTITIALRNAAVAAANPSRSMGISGLTFAVEAAFGASPFAPSPTWTDISAYVRLADGIHVTRGRTSEFSDVQPGTMSLTLDNRARLFDPSYAAGTYFGQLLPQTRIRHRVRHNSINYPIFDGYIQGWPQSYQYPREAVVQINAVDLFSRLATRKLPPTSLALEILADRPAAYFPMLEDSMPVCSDLSGSGWAAKYSGVVKVVDSPLPGESGLKAKNIVETGGRTHSLVSATGPELDLVYSVEAWFNIDSVSLTIAALIGGRVDAASWYVQSVNAVVSLSVGTEEVDGEVVLLGEATLLDATGATAATIEFPYSTDVTYQLVSVLDSTATTWTIYLNGTSVGSSTVSAFTFESGSVFSPGIEIGTDEAVNATFSHFAVYTEELTAARILAHLHAGITGGVLDTAAARLASIANFAGLVDAGLYDDDDLEENTYLGRASYSGSALSAMQEIATTEQGRLFVSSAGMLTIQGRTADMGALTVNSVSQATLADSGANAYVEVSPEANTLDLMRNAIYVSTSGATVQVVDADSRAQYDELEESISAVLDDPTAATNLGLSRLRRFADPSTRVPQVRLIPRSSTDARYPIVLGAELGWRFTIQRTPQSLGSVMEFVETLEGLSLTFGEGHMTADFYLVPALPVEADVPWFTFGTGEFGTEYLLHY
jgi:hypothetical protein